MGRVEEGNSVCACKRERKWAGGGVCVHVRENDQERTILQFNQLIALYLKH